MKKAFLLLICYAALTMSTTSSPAAPKEDLSAATQKDQKTVQQLTIALEHAQTHIKDLESQLAQASAVHTAYMDFLCKHHLKVLSEFKEKVLDPDYQWAQQRYNDDIAEYYQCSQKVPGHRHADFPHVTCPMPYPVFRMWGWKYSEHMHLAHLTKKLVPDSPKAKK